MKVPLNVSSTAQMFPLNVNGCIVRINTPPGVLINVALLPEDSMEAPELAPLPENGMVRIPGDRVYNIVLQSNNDASIEMEFYEDKNAEKYLPITVRKLEGQTENRFASGMIEHFSAENRTRNIVIGICFLAILSVGGFYLWKWYKKTPASKDSIPLAVDAPAVSDTVSEVQATVPDLQLPEIESSASSTGGGDVSVPKAAPAKSNFGFHLGILDPLEDD